MPVSFLKSCSFLKKSRQKVSICQGKNSQLHRLRSTATDYTKDAILNRCNSAQSPFNNSRRNAKSRRAPLRSSAFRLAADGHGPPACVRGAIPVTPLRAHLAFSDRQTAFVPQRANSNMRFFRRQPPSAAPSASFADQRQRLTQTNRSFEPAVANRGRLSHPTGLGGFPSGQAPAENEIRSQRLGNQERGAVDRGRINEQHAGRFSAARAGDEERWRRLAALW